MTTRSTIPQGDNAAMAVVAIVVESAVDTEAASSAVGNAVDTEVANSAVEIVDLVNTEVAETEAREVVRADPTPSTSPEVVEM